MAKLADTSESVLYVGILVLNLDKKLRELLLAYLLSNTRVRQSLSRPNVFVFVGLNRSYEGKWIFRAHHMQNIPFPVTLPAA